MGAHSPQRTHITCCIRAAHPARRNLGAFNFWPPRQSLLSPRSLLGQTPNHSNDFHQISIYFQWFFRGTPLCVHLIFIDVSFFFWDKISFIDFHGFSLMFHWFSLSFQRYHPIRFSLIVHRLFIDFPKIFMDFHGISMFFIDFHWFFRGTPPLRFALSFHWFFIDWSLIFIVLKAQISVACRTIVVVSLCVGLMSQTSMAALLVPVIDSPSAADSKEIPTALQNSLCNARQMAPMWEAWFAQRGTRDLYKLIDKIVRNVFKRVDMAIEAWGVRSRQLDEPAHSTHF